ncbi:MAG: hypothetical protein OXN90_13805 [Gemmatimonadota bacterium]|nr:hypothetical protein [Gemmatimonadota bacterium]
MSSNQLDQGRTRRSAVGVIWQSVQVAVAVAIVVVPFGYAITGVHRDVLIAVSCGFAIGVGLSLRLGPRGGRSTGILIGSAIGILAALTSAVTTGTTGVLAVVSPVLVPLALGLIDGLGPSRLSGYRETSIAALTVTALLGVGLLPEFRGVVLILLLCVPQSALIAGYFNRNPEGQRYSRPPVWLLLVFLAAVVIIGAIGVGDSGWLQTVLLAPLTTLVFPTAVFLSARAFAIWMQPRLNIYVQLVEYLRVMWIPIGGFGAGYLVIVIAFAGFSGMLERFSPGSFAGAADAGIGDWMSFSFFSALGQDYTGITPVTAPARVVVGARLVLSVGWLLVVFAAVMSAIQPQLERIARRNTQVGDE